MKRIISVASIVILFTLTLNAANAVTVQNMSGRDGTYWLIVNEFDDAGNRQQTGGEAFLTCGTELDCYEVNIDSHEQQDGTQVVYGYLAALSLNRLEGALSERFLSLMLTPDGALNLRIDYELDAYVTAGLGTRSLMGHRDDPDYLVSLSGPGELMHNSTDGSDSKPVVVQVEWSQDQSTFQMPVTGISVDFSLPFDVAVEKAVGEMFGYMKALALGHQTRSKGNGVRHDAFLKRFLK